MLKVSSARPLSAIRRSAVVRNGGTEAVTVQVTGMLS